MRSRLKGQMSFCLLASAITVAPAYAQNEGSASPQVSTKPVEITSFASYGSPGASRFGGAISFAWTSNTSVEFEIGYRQSDINALSSNVSFVYTLPRLGRVIPYVAGGAGLGEYASFIAVPYSPTPITQSKL